MKVVSLLLASAVLVGAEKIEILRDEYGVPHIFAATAAGAAFGAGYAQAEDRLEEMLRNYRKAEGTMAEGFGENWRVHDYRQRLWQHREVARRHYHELDPKLRKICEAFQAGVKEFMRKHPEQTPDWAPKLEPWQIIALTRYMMWGWPEADAGGDLRRAGIDLDPVGYRGSNAVLLAPSRTAMHAPIAVIDPHVSWYGEFRFYELRMYGGELNLSGASVVGLPFPALGHNKYLSVAMTTGGPDTADAYEENVKDGKYEFKGDWKPLNVRTERIVVKNQAGDLKSLDVRIESTHHGPVVAHKNSKAYSLSIPYSDEFRLIESVWRLNMAHNLAEAKRALAELQFMGQNILIGTVDGDIYYVRNGRVPIRPQGCDSSRPMPGSRGECEWQGIHGFEDLVQLTNPPQGYMQNCNVSPFAMIKDSPLVPMKWAKYPYLYNDNDRSPPHQRAAMMVDLLDAARNVTAEQAVAIAFSPQVWHADLWQSRIGKAAPDSGLANILVQWNRRSEADSRAALAYYLFKTSLGPVGRSVDPPESLTDEQIRIALDAAEKKLNSDFAATAVFGTLFRVGRQGTDRTWPVSGGTLQQAAMATPRAINFDLKGNQMVGNSGQSSTQIVILTKPPVSYMVLPLGESSHRQSEHYDDQAEKLFSKGLVKSTYFLNRKELEKHVTSRKSLTF